MLIKFFLAYSDSHFLWIFLLKNSVLRFCSRISPLSFLSAAMCGVLPNTYVHHKHPFKTVQRWEKLRRSSPCLPFDLCLGIKQVQTIELIRAGSKEICLGAVQRAVMKLNKCLQVVTRGKGGFVSCKTTDKWKSTLGLIVCLRKSPAEWPFSCLCCLPMYPVQQWLFSQVCQSLSLRNHKISQGSAALLCFKLHINFLKKNCFMSSSALPLGFGMGGLKSLSVQLVHSFVQQIPGRYMLQHNTYMTQVHIPT